MSKKFVTVISKCDTEGKVTPITIVWDGEKAFEIDRILDARQAASLKAGGCGIRYTVMIKGKEKYLFFDVNDKKWFVEGKT